jgi:glycosyltransferase involved in cell wall biosynthesis
MPAYNCAGTIVETIGSLQRIEEGWENVERVLICDDASSDATWSLLHSIEFDKCPLTLLRHENNSGESACYRTMLDVLPDQIRWFLVLHADDLALPNFLARNYEILARCDDRVAAVSSNYSTFGLGNERLAHSPAEDTTVFRGGAEQDIAHTALAGCWWHLSGSLISRDL